MIYNKKIKLFTHNDLDGVGCAIIGRLAFDDIDVEYCGYNNINEKVLNCNLRDYDVILITDISVNEEVASLLNKNYLNGKDISLLDHHITAEWLNKYDWAEILVYDELANKKTSGCSLFLNYLLGKCKFKSNVYSFVESVRMYDTWDWKEKGTIFPKRLNDLLKILGITRFEDKIIDFLGTRINDYKFDEIDEQLLILDRENKELYINSKLKEVSVCNYNEYKVGVVFADQCISELGNKVCLENEEIDFCMIIIGSSSVSFRTVKDIDLSIVAKALGGGGHKKASGAKISGQQYEKILNIFDLELQ